MGKKDVTRQRAKEWFIDHLECTYKDVAELFKVTEKTIGDWAKKDNWEDERLAYHSSSVRIKQILQDEFIWVSQGNKARIDTDALSKINASLERVDRKADPYVAAEVCMAIDNLISKHDPKLAALIVPYHKMFLRDRINQE